MRNAAFETILGALVIMAAIVFLVFSLQQNAGSASGGQYAVTARFDSVSGIERGSDVRMAGVKIGSVVDISYDPERDEASLKLTLRKDIALRDDANAAISQDGLLGGAYVAVNPGGGFDAIPADGTGEILDTQGSVDLLTLAMSLMNQTQDED